MKICVSGGQVIGCKLNDRKVFITPWGCFLDAPKAAPANYKPSTSDYEIEAGVCSALIGDALKAKHAGLISAVSFVEEPAAKAKASPAAPPA